MEFSILEKSLLQNNNKKYQSEIGICVQCVTIEDEIYHAYIEYRLNSLCVKILMTMTCQQFVRVIFNNNEACFIIVNFHFTLLIERFCAQLLEEKAICFEKSEEPEF